MLFKFILFYLLQYLRRDFKNSKASLSYTNWAWEINRDPHMPTCCSQLLQVEAVDQGGIWDSFLCISAGAGLHSGPGLHAPSPRVNSLRRERVLAGFICGDKEESWQLWCWWRCCPWPQITRGGLCNHRSGDQPQPRATWISFLTGYCSKLLPEF